MSDQTPPNIIAAEIIRTGIERRKRKTQSSLAQAPGAGSDFYNGIEWFACWLLDNNEGETIYEERLRGWAVDAWKAHLAKQNYMIILRSMHGPVHGQFCEVGSTSPFRKARR